MTTEQFEALSIREKKVMVAKDIINSVSKGVYIPTEGVYVDIQGLVLDEEDVKSNFEKIVVCESCNLGAALLSITKFANKLTFGDIVCSWNQDPQEDIKSSLGTPRYKIKELLLSVFSEREIALMEALFEADYNFTKSPYAEHNLDYELSREEEDTCIEIYESFDNPKERMLWTMENIIENGEFILKVPTFALD